jgi:hypothetical protein
MTKILFTSLLLTMFCRTFSQNLFSQLTVEKCGFTTVLCLYKSARDVELKITDLESLKTRLIKFKKSSTKIVQRIPGLTDHVRIDNLDSKQFKIFDLSMSDCSAIKPSKGISEIHGITASYNLAVCEAKFKGNNTDTLLFVILSRGRVLQKRIVTMPTFVLETTAADIATLCYQKMGDDQQLLKVCMKAF